MVAGARLGFINEVIPAIELQSATSHWCEQILKCAPLSIRASKENVMRGLDESSLAGTIRKQEFYPAFAAWKAAEDTREGARAFAERQPPRWRGVWACWIDPAVLI
jgi:enoyl-CoA hydratase/carnithine racemase